MKKRSQTSNPKKKHGLPHGFPTTADLSNVLSQIADLMEWNNENPFKVRAFRKAETALPSERAAERVIDGSILEVSGIGKGIRDTLLEWIETGSSTVKKELEAKLPPGFYTAFLDLSRIPGLGPKKIKLLISELQIQSVGELEYACRENRVALLKGFGEKMQEKLLQGIERLKTFEGKQRLEQVDEWAPAWLNALKKKNPKLQMEWTGDYRRRLETLSMGQVLVAGPDGTAGAPPSESPIALRFHYVSTARFASEWIRTTGSETFVAALEKLNPGLKGSTEKEIFEKAGLPFIPAAFRETPEALSLVKQKAGADVLSELKIRGVFHVHTNESDGIHTLEEMIRTASELDYEYIGISDHSQSAFYAKGLTSVRLSQQKKEIDSLQKKYSKIRIFWGVESDILADGGLDYTEKELKEFDFVIASVHSRFKMDRAAMTDRMMRAVSHPATRFLGHWSGRLLLGREPYDFDEEKIIKTCAQNQVAIEINAHPNRLDIDWRYGSLLRKYQTMTCINPDAHAMEGLKDVSYGITVAQKALLPHHLILNTRSEKEVEKWLQKK